MILIVCVCREVGCYPWDVCAGIIIAQEAGALVSGPHNVFAEQSSSSTFSGEVTPEILLGRKYIVVRGMPGIEQASSHTYLGSVPD